MIFIHAWKHAIQVAPNACLARVFSFPPPAAMLNPHPLHKAGPVAQPDRALVS